jgi:multicomponent Na+:H+ antiporter subunit D
MESFLVMLPIIIPFFMATTALLRTRPRRRIAATVGAVANLIACVGILLFIAENDTILSTQMGGHPSPFAITFVIEMLSALMLVITAVVTLAVVVYSYETIDANRERFIYYPLIGFLIMGTNLAFITGDLFTLYVAFELMLLSSFVLMTLGGERGQIEGGIKYVTINLISSTIFLIAAGLTYAVAGTLNIADLSVKLSTIPAPGITTLLAVLFLLAFGVKAAIFPLFYWLPASYHTPPIPVTALFGGLLTKIGIYSMWQVLVVIFPNEVVFLQPIILTLAALTMITGVLGAISQGEWRRLLSFHIISQIGYLMMGLGLATEMGMTGSIFFVLHVILSKTALFFIAGIAYEIRGTYKLKYLVPNFRPITSRYSAIFRFLGKDDSHPCRARSRTISDCGDCLRG